MKITLIIVLSYLYPSTISISGGNSASAITTCSNCVVGPPMAYGSATKKITIPMPDLDACLKARRQFDDYRNLVAVACSAE